MRIQVVIMTETMDATVTKLPVVRPHSHLVRANGKSRLIS